MSGESAPVTGVMRLRCPKGQTAEHYRIDVLLPLNINALSKLAKPAAGILKCACGAEMVVDHG